jgi:N-hydroxyarylamine O-acetyltransferase
MTSPLDLPAYFERIRWRGPTQPAYETLAGVLAAHMAAIPFENLDVLLGRKVRLDLEGLQDKLVRQHRGGYCFEHGTLLAAVLEELGFRPVRHTARVVVIVPRTEAPRAHMFLTVALPEGRFVLDPGFGALAPRLPVPLVDGGAEARAGEEVHWMARDGDHWILRTRAGGKIVDCWVSPLDRDNVIDFEVGNHFTSTHTSSPFVNRVMLRALTADGRVGVMNRDVTVWRGGEPEAVKISDRSALRSLLAEYFGFDLPEVEQLRVPSIPEWQ